MKALLMDVGLVLLIVAVAAGDEGPAALLKAPAVSASDAIESAPGSPKYTPIPDWRKGPAGSSSKLQAVSSTFQPATDYQVDALPAEATASARETFSALPAANPTAPVRVGSAPFTNEAPRYEYAIPSSTPLVDAPATPTSVLNAPLPATGRVVSVTPLPESSTTPVTGLAPSVPAPAYAYQPLVPVAKTPKTMHLGRGIYGQPTVYVPGQPVRNFLRYLSP